MECKIYFSNELKSKFSSVDAKTKTVWKSLGAKNYKELIQIMLDKFNEFCDKIELIDYSFIKDVNVYGQSNTFFGYIKNDIDNIVAYSFVIPPAYGTRSGILSQQVFPVLSGIMTHNLNESYKTISNRPIFIFNMNENSLAPSSVLNIKSAQILGFNYFDLYDRNNDDIIKEKTGLSSIKSIEDYDIMIKKTSNNNKNEYFKLDSNKKSIKFLKTRIKDGTSVTNETYWFALKAHTGYFLAKKCGYTCDMSEIEKLKRGNKTLDSFRDYIKKVEV